MPVRRAAPVERELGQLAQPGSRRRAEPGDLLAECLLHRQAGGRIAGDIAVGMAHSAVKAIGVGFMMAVVGLWGDGVDKIVSAEAVLVQI